MSDPQTPTPDPIASPVLPDALTTAQELRDEAFRAAEVLDLADELPPLAFRMARDADRAAFDAGTSRTIGGVGSAAWAERAHEAWRAQRAELAEAERREVEAIRLDARLSDLGRTEALEALAKTSAEARAKTLGQVQQTVDEVLAGREAACRQFVLGAPGPDERPAEIRALEAMGARLDLASFMSAISALDDRGFAAAVEYRIRRGDPSTPELLELAAHRLSRSPELSLVLASTARATKRERARSSLRADPKRAAALSEIAVLREVRRRIANERAWYAQHPNEPMPVITRD